MCQRKVKRDSVKKVPLGSIQLTDMPLKRVGVDILGPIAPLGAAGHQFILPGATMPLDTQLQFTQVEEWVFLKKC